MVEYPRIPNRIIIENGVNVPQYDALGKNIVGSEVQAGMIGEYQKLKTSLTEREEEIKELTNRLEQIEKKHEASLALLRNQDQALYELDTSRKALLEREKQLSRDLAQKEVEVQQDRAELREQFKEREASLRKEVENQQAALAEREAIYRNQSQELLARTSILEKEHATLQRESRERAVEHKRAIEDLVRQREQFQVDFQLKMEAKAAEYVDTALGTLQSSEQRFDKIGSRWAIGGLIGVLAGLTLAYLLANEATNKIVGNKDISWSLILFFSVKGVVLLGLVIGLVRLCIRLARNYMHESLKSAERRHAINYGKFYLSVYGAGTDGEKLKDVFAHWNTTGTSAFAEKDDAIPSPSASQVSEVLKTLMGLKDGAKDDENTKS
jgi:hypothetical protein